MFFLKRTLLTNVSEYNSIYENTLKTKIRLKFMIVEYEETC